MTNEIKEILQLIGSCCYYGKISEVEYEKYRNYITNLQEEKQEMKNGWQEEIYEKDKVLSDWLEDERKINILQQRLDKAIEYLKSISMDKTPDYIPLKDYKEYHILLNILRGDE